MTHQHIDFNPLIIRQTMGDGDDFDGDVPDGGVQSDPDDPSIIRFENRNSGGRFQPQLDNDPVYNFSSVRRIWADFAGASDWYIEHVQENFYADNSNYERTIVDSGTMNSPVFMSVDILLGPDEHIKMTTSGSTGNIVAEVYFELLSRN
jgi:hypothetical protein